MRHSLGSESCVWRDGRPSLVQLTEEEPPVFTKAAHVFRLYVLSCGRLLVPLDRKKGLRVGFDFLVATVPLEAYEFASEIVAVICLHNS